MSLHVFGIRHHGPGCARSLCAALSAVKPDVVLIEGPPDADDLLSLAKSESMRPPVALVLHPVDAPQRAVFYPFAVFSPEWQAIRYALDNGVPVRFMDLPQAVRFARDDSAEAARSAEDEGETESVAGAEAVEPGPVRRDPLEMLAQAAGYTDHELWWEHQIERRENAADLFEAILEAMAAVRAETAPDPPPDDAEEQALREAHMRTVIRAAIKEGHQKIAVVCGAWHAPALAEPGPAKPDQERLRGLPRVKLAATWIPWTYSRLSYRTGYGAGVASPGWYGHVWASPDRAAVRWATLAARLLRSEDLSAPSASVIEVVRLAEALAAMRDLRAPGLAEMNEAILAVLCGGDTAPMLLIRRRLEIGEVIGEVPEETPSVPLQRDLVAQQRRLRLTPSDEIKTLDLDLRGQIDRDRSALLHRLAVLGIDWGTPKAASGKAAGTFHEFWELRWRPELAVKVIEASLWGNTVAAAAGARLRHEADRASDLAALCNLFAAAVVARLEEPVDHLLARIADQSAVAADVQNLMEALPPLARVARYGDVRGTESEHLLPILRGLLARIVVGLPGACRAIDDDAATTRVEGIGAVQRAIDLLELHDQRDQWRELLRALMQKDGVHGLVRGYCCRLLLDQRAIDTEDLARQAGLALSPANPTQSAASWIQGLLCGSGQVLLRHDALWSALDAWVVDLSQDTFTEIVPLLRRAFSSFSRAERRSMAETVRSLGGGRGPTRLRAAAPPADLDAPRADQVLPVLAAILGVDYE